MGRVIMYSLRKIGHVIGSAFEKWLPGRQMRPINFTGNPEPHGNWSGGLPVKLLKTNMYIWALHKCPVQIRVYIDRCTTQDCDEQPSHPPKQVRWATQDFAFSEALIRHACINLRQLIPFRVKFIYHQVSNIRRTESQNLNVSRLGLQLSLLNI